MTGGFQLLTVLIGLYAITEIAATAYDAVHSSGMTVRNYRKMKGFGFTLKEFKENGVNFLASSAVGTGIGILPGIAGMNHIRN